MSEYYRGGFLLFNQSTCAPPVLAPKLPGNSPTSFIPFKRGHLQPWLRRLVFCLSGWCF